MNGHAAELTFALPDEAATLAMARRVAQACADGAVLHLHGDLGAGKTTFARGVLHALGVVGDVKSPTFTIVEPYHFNGRSAYHFDLYRITDPDELELLGIRDYFTPGAWVLIEWPERGYGVLPDPDLRLEFTYAGSGRRLTLHAVSETGRSMVAALRDGTSQDV
jgi:tRNA threonylcarbamoyladenosine biosynthesis protein TsaE